MNHKVKKSFECRKKIAIVFPKDSESIFNNKKCTFGGATVQLFNYAMELSKKHEVYCLMNETDSIEKSKFPNLNIIFTFSKSDNYVKKIISFHRAIRSVNPDVVIQRGLTRISTFLGFYSRMYGIVYLFMFAHDRECRGRFQRSARLNSLYPLLLFSAHFLIVQNDYQFENIPVLFRKKVSKITSGYSMELPQNSFKNGVLWVSRLEPWKRPEICIEAAVKNPDIQFTMIAPIDDHNVGYADEIFKMAGNSKNIRIIDFVRFDEIDVYFKNSRLFLNTSIEEGFPNTFIQACKNGTPIVSLNVNPDEFITQCGAGEFCNNDISKMNIAIRQICTNNSCFEKYSASAGEYARNNHSIEKNVEKLEELFL